MELTPLTEWLMSNKELCLIPFVGALIGWVTNLLAVKMLFRPRKVRSFLGIKFHGVFPKRKAALAKKVGELVSTELLSSKQVIDALKKKAGSTEAVERIIQKVENFLTKKVLDALPVLTLAFTPDILSKVRRIFITDFGPLASEIVDSIGQGLEMELDVHQIVEEKINSFSDRKFEELLLKLMKKEFRFIELIGAVIGFIVGLVQLFFVYGVSGTVT